MSILSIVLIALAYLIVGWLLAFFITLVSPSWRKAIAKDDPPAAVLILFWPISLVVAVIYFISEFMNPIGLVEKMEERRKARENVIVKSRKFRGKED